MNKWIASLLVLPVLLLGMAAAGEGAHALEAKLKVGAGYQIRVEDQHGEGVQGAYVNICTDTMCLPSVTDAGGVILYDGAPDIYHLQILKVPDGYSFDPSDEVYTEPAYGEYTLSIIRETEGKATHVIRVKDQYGEPVAGAYLNICSDVLCVPIQADERGQVVFVGDPELYHLQVIKVPAGYSCDSSREYYTEMGSDQIVLTVQKGIE